MESIEIPTVAPSKESAPIDSTSYWARKYCADPSDKLLLYSNDLRQQKWIRNFRKEFSIPRPAWPISDYLPICDQLVHQLERTPKGKVCGFTQSNTVEIGNSPQYLFRLIRQLRFHGLELLECIKFSSDEILFVIFKGSQKEAIGFMDSMKPAPYDLQVETLFALDRPQLSLQRLIPKLNQIRNWLPDDSLIVSNKIFFQLDGLKSDVGDKIIETFLHRHPSGVVVCVEESICRELKEKHRARVHDWTKFFGYKEECKVWEESYDQAHKFVRQLPEKFAEMLEPFFHDQATVFKRLAFLAAYLDRMTVPSLILINEDIFLPLSGSENSCIACAGIITSPSSHNLYGAAFSFTSGFKLKDLYSMPFAKALEWAEREKYQKYSLEWLYHGVRWRVMRVLLTIVRFQFHRRLFYRALYSLSNIALALTTGIPGANKFLGQRFLKFVRSPDNNPAFVAVTLLSILPRAIPFLFTRPKRKPILIVVEDSGTRVNLDPTLQLLGELKRRYLPAIVLSSHKNVIKEVRNAGALGILFDTFDSPPAAFRKKSSEADIRNVSEAILKSSANATDRLRTTSIIAKFRTSYFWDEQIVRSYVTTVLELFDVQSCLTVSEIFPTSVICGKFAERRGIPWYGFFPILLGNRPDSCFFPAPRHLLYGEQLRDLAKTYGVPEDSLEVVGTPTFDVMHSASSPEHNRKFVRELVPGWKNERLVVLGTENFPGAMIEIEPLMTALMKRNDVYVVIKLHPEDGPRPFEDLIHRLGCEDRATVIGKCNLEALLQTADLLACIGSNIILKAAVLGTPTLTCDFSGKSAQTEFAKSGLVTPCYDPLKLEETLDHLLSLEKKSPEILSGLKRGLAQFNGPNDGRSHERVVDFVMGEKTFHFEEHPA